MATRLDSEAEKPCFLFDGEERFGWEPTALPLRQQQSPFPFRLHSWKAYATVPLDLGRKFSY